MSSDQKTVTILQEILSISKMYPKLTTAIIGMTMSLGAWAGRLEIKQYYEKQMMDQKGQYIKDMMDQKDQYIKDMLDQKHQYMKDRMESQYQSIRDLIQQKDREMRELILAERELANSKFEFFQVQFGQQQNLIQALVAPLKPQCNIDWVEQNSSKILERFEQKVQEELKKAKEVGSETVQEKKLE